MLLDSLEIHVFPIKVCKTAEEGYQISCAIYDRSEAAKIMVAGIVLHLVSQATKSMSNAAYAYSDRLSKAKVEKLH